MLDGLGEHKGLLEFTLRSSEYDWDKDKLLEQGGFTFPNLELLRIENGSPIAQKNNLPKLDKLKALEIINTYIDQPLSKNKLKHVRLISC